MAGFRKRRLIAKETGERGWERKRKGRMRNRKGGKGGKTG